MGRLKNKVVVITGGNSGIGLGIAKEFKNEGAKGAIVGRNQETLDSSVAQLGDNFIAINADVTNLAGLERVFKETAEKFGKIDVIVANAGGGTIGNCGNYWRSRLRQDDGFKPQKCLLHCPQSTALYE